MKTTELMPINSRQKSFYKKAHVTEYSNGQIELTSYDTVVCKITPTGEFKRLWDGWSATTSNHVNEFLVQNGFKKLSKKEWLELPVERYSIVAEIVKLQNELKRTA